MSQHRFRPQPHDTAVPRMIPTRRLCNDLDLIHGDADSAKHSQGIGLGVERINQRVQRTRLDEMEVNILRGILTSTQYWVRKAKERGEDGGQEG